MYAIRSYYECLVKGKVIVKGSKEELPYATVQIIGLDGGVVTNEHGEFEINHLGKGRHRLRRITSYNVCYTKLLRIPDRYPTLFSVPGEQPATIVSGFRITSYNVCYTKLLRNNKKSILTQTAFYESKGLFGLLYWYALYPLHRMIFWGMIRSIKMKAENTY